MTTQARELLLRLAEPPNCPRCEGRSLLLVRFPHSWVNSRGQELAGFRHAALCPACDRGDEPADTLIALLAVDGQLGPDNANTFGELVAAWADFVGDRTPDKTLLADEEARWCRGDL
ncbi:DUF6300 family protein [Streptomyces decoyicus]|uniref:DUF6300 family protein n=1 Tax=Streptomyces decoyicus TaxID=249567 RepID=UPI003647A800